MLLANATMSELMVLRTDSTRVREPSNDNILFAVKKMMGRDEPIRTVSACRPNGNTYTISFSLADKQCSHVMVRVNESTREPLSVASEGRCSPINREG